MTWALLAWIAADALAIFLLWRDKRRSNNIARRKPRKQAEILVFNDFRPKR